MYEVINDIGIMRLIIDITTPVVANLLFPLLLIDLIANNKLNIPKLIIIINIGMTIKLTFLNSSGPIKTDESIEKAKIGTAIMNNTNIIHKVKMPLMHDHIANLSLFDSFFIITILLSLLIYHKIQPQCNHDNYIFVATIMLPF